MPFFSHRDDASLSIFLHSPNPLSSQVPLALPGGHAVPLLPFCLLIPPAAGRRETSCRFQTLVRYPGKLREVQKKVTQGDAGCHGVSQGVFCSVDPVNFVRFRLCARPAIPRSTGLQRRGTVWDKPQQERQ